MAEAAKPVLFICYSHTDQKYRERFTKFLDSPALQNMTTFHDAKIQPGEDWLQRILGSLQKATAALVLVSQDFMISPFIQQVELREILTNHVRRGLRLFLVPVRSTLYQGTYLERLEWARPPDKPLALLSEAEQENAMVEICLKIGTPETKADAPTIESTIECLESMPKLDLPSAYELRELVGEGEFARCYRAHDPLLERDVIIKVLHTPLSRDSPAYDKYVRSTSRLNHRNILGLHFSQAMKLPHFIVTPDIGDVTLDKWLAGHNGDPPSLKDKVECLVKLAGALSYAHAHKSVHGRLRPCEVRFDQEGEPVLSGFRTLEACGKASWQEANGSCRLEDFQYSSPEYRDSGVLDEKGDQYLLGLIAYEVISGGPPVRLESWGSVLNPTTARALLHPRPLKKCVKGCDGHLSDVVMRMLSENPEARWKSLDDVRKELQHASSQIFDVEEAKAS
jgi:Protein tyrosine and serine/threonine kinase/TIR domain